MSSRFSARTRRSSACIRRGSTSAPARHLNSPSPVPPDRRATSRRPARFGPRSTPPVVDLPTPASRIVARPSRGDLHGVRSTFANACQHARLDRARAVHESSCGWESDVASTRLPGGGLDAPRSARRGRERSLSTRRAISARTPVRASLGATGHTSQPMPVRRSRTPDLGPGPEPAFSIAASTRRRGTAAHRIPVCRHVVSHLSGDNDPRARQ